MEHLITTRVDRFTHDLATYCERAGRTVDSVTVLLATKTQEPPAIAEAIGRLRHHGVAVIVGENRVQELVAKADFFNEQRVPAHLIGPLQSNKVNAALRSLATASGTDQSAPTPFRPCIQTISDMSTAERISSRLGSGQDLDVMIQVNSSQEPTKSGVAPAHAYALAEDLVQLPNLRLVGFMTIGPRDRDQRRTTAAFAEVRALRDEIRHCGIPGSAACEHLSMGMSDDISIAIATGATIVRPGTAIFANRS